MARSATTRSFWRGAVARLIQIDPYSTRVCIYEPYFLVCFPSYIARSHRVAQINNNVHQNARNRSDAGSRIIRSDFQFSLAPLTTVLYICAISSMVRYCGPPAIIDRPKVWYDVAGIQISMY